MRQLRMLVAVAVAPAITAQAPRQLPVTVVSSFGGDTGNPDTDLYRVTEVIRTDGGQFVVASVRPVQVRLYDRTGRFVRQLGRGGEGPGEFRYGANLRRWAGDSVLTFSQGSRRWMLFSLDGDLVREWALEPGEPSPFRVTLVGGAYAVGDLGGEAPCRAETVRRLAPLNQPFRQALVDPAGNIWLGTPNRDEWMLHGPDGARRGVVALPGLIPTQLTGDLVVGYREDDDGFNEVVAFRVSGLAAGVPRSSTCAVSPMTSPRAADIRTTMRNAMTAAEAYYSDNRRYPKAMDEVSRMLELPEGIQGRFEPTATDGFAFTAWDERTGFRCLVSVGFAIRGYPDGVIGCGG